MTNHASTMSISIHRFRPIRLEVLGYLFAPESRWREKSHFQRELFFHLSIGEAGAVQQSRLRRTVLPHRVCVCGIRTGSRSVRAGYPPSDTDRGKTRVRRSSFHSPFSVAADHFFSLCGFQDHLSINQTLST